MSNEIKGDGAYVNTDPVTEQEKDDDLWNSAKLLVNELGYTFDEVVDHLGVSKEQLKKVIKDKMNKRSDTISKSYEAGEIDEHQYEKGIAEVRALHKFLKDG